MNKALPLVFYLALSILWTVQVARESKKAGMEPVFWSATAFLLPLFIGVYLFFRTKREVAKDEDLEKIRKPIITTILLALFFLISLVCLWL